MLIKKFEEQVNQNPHAMAAKTLNAAFTYGELNHYANWIAHTIQNKYSSTCSNQTVGLLFDHGVPMIAALLGVLKAGKIYVPLAPDYPQSRLSYMVQDADVSLILTDQANETSAKIIALENNIPYLNIEEINRERVVENPVREITGNKLAYIIYTSGSTGLPKGVMQTHENVYYYIRNWIKIFAIVPSDRMTLISSFSHDAAVMDIYAALLSGASLYPFNLKRDERAGSLELSEFLVQEKLTVWHSVPSLYHYFVNTLTETDRFPRLRFIILGGEPVLMFHVDMFQKYFPQTKLANIYGQSESSANSIWIVGSNDHVGKVTIGKTLDCTKIFLVNDKGKEAKPFETGEILVSSPHLSPGYWHKEELSKKVFTKDPKFGSLYWTGDVGRLLLNGEIEFIGRRDSQVKIRGYRIELGEIETLLLKHQAIKEAAVTAKKDAVGDWFIVAYIIVKDNLTESERNVLENVHHWREYLANSLPDYMIPAYFVHMEQFPLTASFKIDRKALPDPEIGTGKDYVAPTNETEQKLTRIWAEVLAITEDKIGIQANFFELGGHSLKAAALTLKIHKEFNAKVPLEEVFKRVTISSLAQYIQAVEKELFLAVEPAEKKSFYPLSSAQKRLYFLQMMEETSTGYNMSQVMELEGKIAMERLGKTFTLLIQRHESFRTSFLMVAEEPVQRIFDTVSFAIEISVAAPLMSSAKTPEALINAFIRPFNLSQAPLLRVGVVPLAEDSHLLLVDMHHIISDGTSMGVLIKEFMDLYESRPLPQLRLHYKDYAVWTTQRKDELSRQEAYWLKEFADEMPLLDLPLDYSRPQLQQFVGNSVPFTLDAPNTHALKALALQQGVTLYMVLLAVYNIFLAKVCNQEIVAVGTPTAGRRHADLGKVIGMFVNTLVLKNSPAGDKNPCSFLAEVKVNTLNAFANQDYQYEGLVEKVVKNRDTSRNPLFDTMFVLQNQDIPTIENSSLKLKYYPYERQTAKFDLTLMCIEFAGQLYCSLEYCTALLKEATVQRFTRYFQNVLSSVLASPYTKIAEIEIISEAEKEQILFQFNNTCTKYPKDKTIPHIFAEQAHRFPDHMAIIAPKNGEGQVTYSELNKKSNQLAHVLLSKGVSPDTIVAIMVERSIEMIIGILGILKSGGAYLPIDPDYPEDRKQFMLSDSAAKILITAQFIQEATLITPIIPIIPILPIIPITLITPTNLAYIIYTSGTTGKPKGVLVTHENVVRLLFNDEFQFQFNENDVWTIFHSYCFDFSVWEMYGALLFGGKLILIPRVTAMDTRDYLDILKREAVTVLNQTPSSFYRLVEEELPIAAKALYLRYIIFGGEALQPKKLKEWHLKYPFTTLINMYGITETTVHVTYKEITHEEMAAKVSNIGKPIPTLNVYIMDSYCHLLPIGLSGEIYVGGAGVARGYLNRPQLTHDKFISPSTLSISSITSISSMSSTKFYKTGDLARWLPDGDLEYLGRIDHQVKIRGFRIELGEIENLLLSHDQINDAVVIVRDENNGDKSLVAYFVADKELSSNELRDYLLNNLPDYMIPAYFMRLEKIPLTANGKINKKALPKPEFKPILANYAPPRTKIEHHLAEIWSVLLDIQKEKIGIHDNFFELGGHSLKANTMMARIHKAMDIKIDLAQIFKNSTIAGLALLIEKSLKNTYAQIEAAEAKEYYALSSAQKRLYFLQMMAESGTMYNMSQGMNLTGQIELHRLEDTFKKLIQRHEGFRTSFLIVAEAPVQRIFDRVEFEIDKNGMECQPEAFIKTFIRPFNLSQAPLLRVAVLPLAQDAHLLMVDMHHIISDGISMGVLVNDFMTLYQGENLPALRLHYKDYAVWETQQKDELTKQETYWLKEFGDPVPLLDLPLDYVRPQVQQFVGNSVGFLVGSQNTRALNALALKHGLTLFMVLQAIYTIFLAKICNQDVVVVGTPTAGRAHADLEHVIGMFVNTLVLKNAPAGDKNLPLFLEEVKEKTLNAFANQNYQYEALVEKVMDHRETSHNPLFDTMFVLQNQDIPTVENSTLKLTAYAYERHTSKFDLSLLCIEFAGDISCNLEYCTRLFKPATILRFTHFFKKVISAVLENPQQKISEIEIISEADKEQILFHFNNTCTAYPKEKTIPLCFEEQTKRTPDHIAIYGVSYEYPDWAPSQLTYAELNKKSTQLAQILIEMGVLPDTIVAIKIKRSIEMVIAVLGILKAGGAYLPIALDYPQERIDFMLSDSAATILLTPQFIQEATPILPILPILPITPIIPRIPITPILPTNLAYVIYTSGSTGTPKGVLVEHGNVIRLVKNTNFIDFLPDDRILQTGALEFDASTFEIWGALLNSLTLYLESKEDLLNAQKLKRIMTQNHITMIWLTSQLFNHLVQMDVTIFAQLRHLLVGGDVLSPAHINLIRRQFPHLRIINGYGPTENTTFSTTFVIDAQYEEKIPIGKPIANSTAYIFDKTNHLSPIGVPGELVVGGAGIARGYLNNPDLTHHKFLSLSTTSISSTTSTSSIKLYKTGDLARWLTDGTIEFLGRLDTQVKIRGFRIELGEIEKQLLTHTQINEAILIAKEGSSGEKYLCAYIVLKGAENAPIESLQLREYLSKRLPDYMIPAYFVPMDHIPLTSNGKVNWRVLPEPEIKFQEGYVPPRTKIEKELLDIWSFILGIQKEKIGIHDNFFERGGHSLKATTMMFRIHKVLETKIQLTQIFTNPTIAELAELIEKSAKNRFASIEAAEKKEYYPLSSAQKRLYFLQILDETSTGYNMPQIFKLAGTIQWEKLANSFNKLVERHQSFRTSFFILNEEPKQRIDDHVLLQINTNFSDVKDFVRPFDLSMAPLLRVGLVSLAAEESLLMVDMHHIISDGTSMGVLVNDFMALYQGANLPELRLHYKDFAVWENLRQTDLTSQEAHWLAEFKDAVPVLDLPLDYVRPRVKSVAGSTVQFLLDSSHTQQLNALALQHGVTLFMVVLAVYNIFLAKICNQDIIVVGTPSAGRSHADLEQVIGMFVNTLVLKNAPAGHKSFHAFLAEVKEKTLHAFANQDYQYDELVEKILKNRETSRNPLFDTMFVLQNLDVPTIKNSDLSLAAYSYEQTTAKFDLTFICTEMAEQIACTLEYCTRLFERETILRFETYLKHIVASVLHDPNQPLAQIDMLPQAEKKQLVVDFNTTSFPYPDNKTIYQLFEDQVHLVPDQIALTFEGQNLTFRHFNECSNLLAHYLIAEQGIQHGDRVLVVMDRSIELIFVLMAVMKARAAYVPMDISMPTERIRIVLNDASIGIVLSQQKYLSKLAPLQTQCPALHSILCIEHLQNDMLNYSSTNPVSGQATDPAYVMYTSGSTGIPKGVLVEHRTIVNTIIWRKNNYEYAPGYVSLQVPPYFFDSSVTDIFTPLLGGSRLVLIRDEERSDLTVLKKTITKNSVTHFIVVPIFYNVLLEEIADALNHIKMICCAGDNFPDELIRKHFERLPHVRIFNEYGPTENSVNSTAYELHPQSPKALIGKPINNVAVYVLDKRLGLCPLGVTGELCLAGSSLSRGYLNRPELTHEKFVKAQLFENTSPLFYRTGDLGRWLADGNLEFLGRVDNQVKIRGMRIEIGEIENQLLKHEQIKEVVVLLRQENGDESYLSAYIVPHSLQHTDLEPHKLKEYLSHVLPGYMIPAYFPILEKLPLTPNGKLDIKALPAPPQEPTEAYAPARNELEQKLIEIWEAVLRKKDIGINHNFFSIGGDSIKSIQILSRLKSAGYQLEMKDLFQYPFISQLSNHVAKLAREVVLAPDDHSFVPLAPLEPWLELYPDAVDVYPLSPMQAGMLFHALLDPFSHAYFQQTAFRLQGQLDIPLVEKSLNELVTRHDILRTAFVHKDIVRPLQIVLKNRPVAFNYLDLGHILDNQEKETFVREYKDRDKQSAFNLSKDMLMRASILRLDQSTYEFIWSFPHILMDGWCIGIINSEFFRIYSGNILNRSYALPPVKPYRTYIQWLEKQDKDQSRLYWEHYLNAFAEQTGILKTTLKNKESGASYSNQKISIALDIPQTNQLKTLAARNHVTLNTLTQTLWALLLGKYTGKEDVVFGAVVSGRPSSLEGVESIIGLFINTIPVRIRLAEKMKFHQLMQKVQAVALVSESYHYHPLADIQSRSPLKQNLLDHLFVFENYPLALEIEGDQSEKNTRHDASLVLKLTNVNAFGQTNYDFNVLLAETTQLTITFQYNGFTLDHSYVNQIAHHFLTAFAQVLQNEACELREITMLSPQEKRRLLEEFNHTAAPYPADKTIPQLFAEQVHRTPDHIALISQTSSPHLSPSRTQNQITYAQLNNKAIQLATYLQTHGVSPESIVAIKIHRSIEMIIGILAILQAGAAYLPIAPDYPEDRIQFMLSDSTATILLTHQFIQVATSDSPITPILPIIPIIPIIPITPSIPITPITPAYIIYTSGSTGTPKGVVVTHQNIVRLVKNTNYVALIPGDSILQTGALEFDASTFEIWGVLLNGLKLVLVNKEMILSPQELKSSIRTYHISTMWLTSPLFNQILQQDSSVFAGLKNLLVGGDVLSPDFINRVRQKYPRLNVINGYGPTENTTFSTTFLIQREYSQSIPIGKPIANSTAYILDKNNHLLPIGIPGELIVGGDGVALGYLNNPELTQHKFFAPVTLPTSSATYYRTGDLARWLPDGTIEFLGRIDTQVKIRGFRIELGEIENLLNSHPLIKETVVLERKKEQRQYLCLYYTIADVAPHIAQLKEFIAAKLPSYMVPSCFVKLDRIPLNANGKVDRAKLPHPQDADFIANETYQPPVTAMQFTIVNIWQEVLGLQRIGIQDNFFDLGGNSLDLVRVANKMREKLAKDIPLTSLFTYPTIGSVEHYLTHVELPDVALAIPENFVLLHGSPGATRNVFFVHEVLGDVGAYTEFSKQLGTSIKCWGIEAEDQKNVVPQNVTVEEISARYIQQIRQVQPHGPYYIATWSWGGHLGLEMTLQLETIGETVSFLGFVDSSGPDYRPDDKVAPFSVQTEREYIKGFFDAAGNTTDLEQIQGIDPLWAVAVEFLSNNPDMVERLRQILISNAMALPNYFGLTGRELVHYLNINRAHRKASIHYAPAGKIHAPLHFFWANQNTGRVESWQDYCYKPVIYHEIYGDHHSIFRDKEQITQFAQLFTEVVSQSIPPKLDSPLF